MSDAEAAYRSALADVYGAGNVMCFFHLKQAVRDNLYKRMSGRFGLVLDVGVPFLGI